MKVPSDQELWNEAMEILAKHLSPSKMMRIISMLQMGHGDYLREREEMFGQQSVAEIAKRVRRYERRKPTK